MASLSGIKVLDLTNESGAFTSRILADLGADVILIEPPEGCSIRNLAPFLNNKKGIERSLYHLHHNANKRSVTLDINKNNDLNILKKLVVETDILIETFAPGQMAKFALDYDTLKSINPKLIYVSITPFGQNGEWKNRTGNDLTAAAASGLIFIAGETKDPPNHAAGNQSYKMASLAASSGILIALVSRKLSKKNIGSYIDISIQESTSMAVLQTSNANHFIREGNIPQRPGMTRGVFKCADGKWTTLNVTSDRYEIFLNWLLDSGINLDIDYEISKINYESPMLAPKVLNFTKILASRHKRKEFLEKAWSLDLMALPVNDFYDLEENEHLKETQQFLEIWHEPLGQNLGFSRSIVDVFEKKITINRAPLLGEHTNEILNEYNLN
tara:strand:- start:9892 stop:11046 length:1155 start_codon:yes stop_codon:yes gene_type:complete